MDRLAALILLLWSTTAAAVGTFNSTFVQGPIPTAFERVGNTSKWTFAIPGAGGAAEWTIGAAFGNQTLGKTYGVGGGSSPAIMSQAQIKLGKVATALKPTVAWLVVKSSVNKGILTLAKASPYVAVASMGLFAYDIWLRSGLSVDENGALRKAGPSTVAANPTYYYYKSGTKYAGFSSPQLACDDVVARVYTAGTVYAVAEQIPQAPTQYTCRLYSGSTNAYLGNYGASNMVQDNVFTCPEGYVLNAGSCQWASGTPPSQVVSDSEAEGLLDATTDPNPEGTVKDVIDHGQSIELQTPSVTGPASVSGPSQTTTHPDGTKTVTNTTYNVTYNTNTVTVTETTVNQEKNADGTNNGEPETTEASPDPDEKTDCEINPGYLQCWEQGTDPGPVEIATKEIPIALTPEPLAGGGDCPAPLPLSFLGFAFEWSFEPLCQFAAGIHFVVLALAWLAAGLIIVGPVRSTA